MEGRIEFVSDTGKMLDRLDKEKSNAAVEEERMDIHSTMRIPASCSVAESQMFDKLIFYLGDKGEEARLMAVQGVLGYSQDQSFLSHACRAAERRQQEKGTDSEKCDKSLADPLIRPSPSLNLSRQLLKLVGDDRHGGEISEAAVKAMTSLAEHEGLALEMIGENAIHILMENIQTAVRLVEYENVASLTKQNSAHKVFCCAEMEGPHHVELNLMLLANLSRHEEGQLALLQIRKGRPKPESSVRGLFLERLLCLFFGHIQPSQNGLYPDKYLWVAHIMANLSAHEEGRLCLLKKGADFFTAISRQLRSGSKGRVELLLQVIYHLCGSIELHSRFGDCLGDEFVPRLLALVYPPEGAVRQKFQQPDAFKPNASLLKGMPDFGGHSNASAMQPEMNDKPRNAAPEQFDEFGSDSSLRFLHPIVKDDIHPFLESVELRRLIFQCVASLCQSKDGRSILRPKGTYEVLRVWHLMESDPKIKLV